MMRTAKLICKEKAYAAGKFLLSVLYPDRCPLCDRLLMPGESICACCEKEVGRVRGAVCLKCGKPLSDERREYCFDCTNKKHYFTQGKAVFLYEGKIRSSLYRFKYKNRREYAGYYAGEAAAQFDGWLRGTGVQAIVPIPMYRSKQRLRGYNQAEVFAQALGQRTGIPVDRKLLLRVRNTTPQKELNEHERKYNLKNAFQLRADIVKYNRILLADDIYTTGSTMDEASKTLLEAGATKIYFICIGTGAGYR